MLLVWFRRWRCRRRWRDESENSKKKGVVRSSTRNNSGWKRNAGGSRWREGNRKSLTSRSTSCDARSYTRWRWLRRNAANNSVRNCDGKLPDAPLNWKVPSQSRSDLGRGKESGHGTVHHCFSHNLLGLRNSIWRVVSVLILCIFVSYCIVVVLSGARLSVVKVQN